MKTIRECQRLGIIRVCLLFAGLVSSPFCKAGLLGHWAFDEGAGTTAVDSIARHDGTIQGATFIPGRIGTSALHFTGINSYVSVGGIGTELELNNTPYTISCWVRWS